LPRACQTDILGRLSVKDELHVIRRKLAAQEGPVLPWDLALGSFVKEKLPNLGT